EIRFIVDGGTGEVAFPADRGMLEAEELVLFIPRDQPADDHELQLLLSAKEVDGEATGLVDRWTAYHRASEMPFFASCRTEAGKFDGAMIDVNELVSVNTVRAVEGRMLKRVNADKTRLRAACLEAQAEILSPVAVGTDQYGIEVRAAFGIVRVF